MAEAELDDGANWEATYRAHSDRLIRLATVLVGANDAGDLVSEAVRRAVHARSWSRADDRGAYLTATLVNQAKQFHRARSRRVAREDRAERLTTSSLPLEADLDIRRALGVLSAQQRAVVYLVYWEDLAIPQVAVALGVSEGSVRKQLARAKQKLAEVLR
jgi:RNA polymerase sigma factor (sigma-70 family)